MREHTCNPPTIVGAYHPFQPDWECGVCGRIWRDSGHFNGSPARWWAEVRGPMDAAAEGSEGERPV